MTDSREYTTKEELFEAITDAISQHIETCEYELLQTILMDTGSTKEDVDLDIDGLIYSMMEEVRFSVAELLGIPVGE